MNPLDPRIISETIAAVIPVASVMVTAMVVLLLGAFNSKSTKALLPFLSIAGVGITAVLTLGGQGETFQVEGMHALDGFSIAFDLILLAAVAFAIAISASYINREGLDRGEYYCLMLFSTAGAMLMAGASNLILIFLGLELLSIPLYVLAGFARTKPDGEEAALKYFLLGAFASAFLAFGAALVFSATGSTSISSIPIGFQVLPHNQAMLLTIGLGMVVVALAFKVALVPFHMWTPDVYQGAPTSVTAFMAVVAKAAGFGALVRISALGLQHQAGNWNDLLWGLSAATMIWGNLIAISQQNIKRMLAYSSIAHAGYLLMGILAATPVSVSAILFYLATYAAMTLGAFAVVIAFAGKGDKYENINDYRGIARRNPALGTAMTVFMFSLAGIPPFAGFFAKLYLFLTAIETGYTGLTVLAVLTSVAGVYYYLRVTVVMWMEDPREDAEPLKESTFGGLVITALVIIVVGLGILSSPVMEATTRAALSLQDTRGNAQSITDTSGTAARAPMGLPVIPHDSAH